MRRRASLGIPYLGMMTQAGIPTPRAVDLYQMRVLFKTGEGYDNLRIE